jgi:hypothetical protein
LPTKLRNLRHRLQVREQRGDVQVDRHAHVALGLSDRAAVAEAAGQLGLYSSGSFSITIAKLSNRIAALPLGCDHHTTRQCPGVIFPAPGSLDAA